MELEYTKDEMLALWKRLRWLEPLRADASVVRSDGTDLDRVAETEMRQWYLRLLEEAPLEMLPLTDLASQAMVSLLPVGSAPDCFSAAAPLLEVSVPRTVIRLARLQMRGMAVGADIVEDPADPRWRLAFNRFRRQAESPVALWLRASSVILLPAPADGSLPGVTHLHAVVDPGPDLYRFPESALSAIAEMTPPPGEIKN